MPRTGDAEDTPEDDSEGSDTENPELSATVTDIALPASKKARMYTMKPYESNGRDQRLGRELREWRGKVYKDYWGGEDSLNLGECLVMPDQILHRLVGLAHYGQLKSSLDVVNQT
jgi:hypothetical protein